MKSFKLLFLAATFVITSAFLTACQKENIDHSTTTPDNRQPVPDPGSPADTYNVKVKAVISIGHIVYDSIPASLHITTWDINNTEHHKDTAIAAGTNLIRLPKAYVKYRLSVSQWGITKAMTFTKAQIEDGATIALGGHREPKKLKKEETYVEVQDGWKPQNRIVYNYNADGSLQKVDSYQNYNSTTELTLSGIDKYEYNNSNVSRIAHFDGNNSATGFIEFTYTPQGKVQKIHDNGSGQDTYVDVLVRNGGIDMAYTFFNGNTMTYNMFFKGGNAVQDMARTSRGTSQDGKYTYDQYINPYAHMNMPNLFLSHESRNNITAQDVIYEGDFPVLEPVKSDYKYDAEGYPVEKITSYRGHGTNTILHREKTVYTY